MLKRAKISIIFNCCCHFFWINLVMALFSVVPALTSIGSSRFVDVECCLFDKKTHEIVVTISTIKNDQ